MSVNGAEPLLRLGDRRNQLVVNVKTGRMQLARSAAQPVKVERQFPIIVGERTGVVQRAVPKVIHRQNAVEFGLQLLRSELAEMDLPVTS